MRARAAVGLALFAACLRPDHGLLGKTCTQDSDCEPLLRCVDLVCAEPTGDGGNGADAGGPGPGPNLLPNGGFDSGLAGWSPVSSSLLELSPSVFRTAAPSLRVHPDTPAGSYLGVSLGASVVSPVVAATTYCAEAWLNRGTTTGAFVLIVRRYDALGGWEDSPRNPGSTQTPVDDGWVRLVDRIATRTGDASVNLRLYTSSFAAGDAFFVDDLRVWTDPTGACAN